MADATVQVNVRLDPSLVDATKARAQRERITFVAAISEALILYTQSNGSADPVEGKTSRAATRGE
jgi:hypothetical protein